MAQSSGLASARKEQGARCNSKSLGDLLLGDVRGSPAGSDLGRLNATGGTVRLELTGLGSRASILYLRIRGVGVCVSRMSCFIVSCCQGVVFAG